MYQKLINSSNLPDEIINNNGVLSLYLCQTSNVQNLLSVGKKDSVVQTYSLTLEKQVEGSTTQQDQKFRFTIKLMQADGSAIPTGSYAVKISENGKVTSATTTTITGGSTAATLTNGQSITIDGLPKGYRYEIQEIESTATTALTNYNTEATTTAKDAVYDEGSRKITSTGNIEDLNTTVTFTNTAVASLTIGKSVTGAATESTFKFDVTLKDADGNLLTGPYTVGTTSVTFPATLSINTGENKTIRGLPSGYSYTITEQQSNALSTTATGAESYNSTTKTASGSNVTALTTTVQYVNKYADNSHTVTLTKMVEAPEGTDPDLLQFIRDNTYFEFTIVLFKYGYTGWNALSTSTITYNVIPTAIEGVEAPDYNSLTFTYVKSGTLTGSGNQYGDYNVATVRLKHGQSITFTGLQDDYCYRIIETPNSMYTTTATQTNEMGEGYVYNSTGNSKYTVDAKARGSAVGPFIQNAYLKKSQNNGNYIHADVKFTNTLDTSQNRTLTLTKQVQGIESSDDAFEFEIRLSRNNGATALSGDYPVEYFKDEVSTGTGTLNFVEKTDLVRGVATVSLKSGESIRIKGLPTDLRYEITELNAEGYEVSWKYTNTSGGTSTYSGTRKTEDGETVPGIAMNYGTSVTTTDLYLTAYNTVHALTLSKTVVGSEEEQLKDFTFEITLSESLLGPAISGTYPVESSGTDGAIAPSYTSLTFDSNGQATVKLKHGQSITIKGLPDGYVATAEELDVDSGHYSTTVTVDDVTTSKSTCANVGNDKVSLSTDYGHTIAFTNTSTKRSLTISKTVDSDSDYDNDLEFLFQVTLYTEDNSGQTSAIDGFSKDDLTFGTTSYGIEMPTKDGVNISSEGGKTVLTFKLKHGQKVSIENLPDNTKYIVTEPEATETNGQVVALSCFSTTIDQEEEGAESALQLNGRTVDGTLSKNNDVVFTNTRVAMSAPATGLRTNVWPYVLMAAFTLGLGLVLMMDKRKRGKEI